MIRLLALLLAAAPVQRVVLVDETVRVPPRSAKGVTAVLQQERAVIEVSCRLVEGDEVLVVVLPPPGAGARRVVYMDPSKPRDHPYRYLAAAPGEYQIVVDNKGDSPAQAVLKVTLAFGVPGAAEPLTLPPRRRSVVLGLSLLFLAAVGWVSARRILPLFRRPPPPGLPPLS